MHPSSTFHHKPIIRQLTRAFILLLLAGTPMGPLQGESGTIQVHVNIIAPILVEGREPVDFGAIIPVGTSSNTVYRLAPDGTLTVNGENTENHAGGQTSGRFAFSGSEGQNFSYDARVSEDFSDPGLSLTAVHTGEVGRHKGSGAFASGEMEIAIGGDLRVNGSPRTGQHGDAVVTLSVHYD